MIFATEKLLFAKEKDSHIKLLIYQNAADYNTAEALPKSVKKPTTNHKPTSNYKQTEDNTMTNILINLI